MLVAILNPPHALHARLLIVIAISASVDVPSVTPNCYLASRVLSASITGQYYCGIMLVYTRRFYKYKLERTTVAFHKMCSCASI